MVAWTGGDEVESLALPHVFMLSWRWRTLTVRSQRRGGSQWIASTMRGAGPNSVLATPQSVNPMAV